MSLRIANMEDGCDLNEALDRSSVVMETTVHIRRKESLRETLGKKTKQGTDEVHKHT